MTTSYWHPFADMSVVSQHELVLERGEGVYVYDADGKRYLDISASLWYCLVGHGRAEIADAVAEQIRTLEAYSTFGDITSGPTRDLAAKVASLAPGAGSKVFLTSGGSDSIDTAAKLSRRFHQLSGQSSRTWFIVREGAYHGMHAGGTSLAGIEAMATGYGTLLGEVARIEWDSVEALEARIEQLGAENVAAFFCEPVMGVAGVLAPPPGYLTRVQEVCARHGVLFVVDEVITGFGRTGDWFASTRFGLEPDIIVGAKGITSGYLPLGVVIASERIAEPFWNGSSGFWRHGYTYSGHATTAAAALANLEIIEREGLLQRALDLEELLLRALAPLVEHPLVARVNAGVGALAAIRFTDEVLASPGMPAIAAGALREAGVLTRVLVGGEIQISPPLIFEEAHVDELVTALERMLEACAEALPTLSVA